MADTDTDTESNPVTPQELHDEFDIRLIRRGSTDPVEVIDVPFKDIVTMLSRATAERIRISTAQAAQEASRIITAH